MARANDSCAVRALLVRALFAVVLLLTAAANGASARRVPLQATGESDVVEAAAAAKSYSFVLVPLDAAGGSSPNACSDACAAADASYVAVRGGNGFTGDQSQNMCAVKKQGKTLYGTGSFSTTKNKYVCSYRPGLKAARFVTVATGVFCACTTSCKGGGLEAEVNCEEKLWSAKTCDTGACSKGCLCRWVDSAYDYDLNLFFGYSDPLKPNVCITPAGAQPVSSSAFASSSGSGGGGFSSECRQ